MKKAEYLEKYGEQFECTNEDCPVETIVAIPSMGPQDIGAVYCDCTEEMKRVVE